MGRMNMPVEREESLENQGKGEGNLLIYKPLPDKNGEVFTNELLIGLMEPNRWKIFNPDQNMKEMFNMTGAGIIMPDGSPLTSFYFKMPVHGIPNFRRSDGSTGYTYVICPTSMNDYLVTTFGSAPMFHDSIQCAFCQEREKWWGVSNERWGELDLGVWDLKGEVRRAKVDSDPVLKNASKMAGKYGVNDRYALSIFDYGKMIGTRPLDEGQTSVGFQSWLAPKKTVFEPLRSHHKEGWEFWDFDNEAGVQVVKLSKDTTGVSQQNPWGVAYSVTMAPQKVQLIPEILAYIRNPENQVDPSDFVAIVSYEAMLAHIAGSNQLPTTAPGVAAGQPPVAQAAVTPQAAQIAQSVGVAQPVATTPQVVPAAQSVSQVVPAAAQPVAQPVTPPLPTNMQPTAPAGTPPLPSNMQPPVPSPTPPPPVTANPIPSIPNRTPPEDSGAAEPPINPVGTPGLGGQSW